MVANYASRGKKGEENAKNRHKEVKGYGGEGALLCRLLESRRQSKR